jgi:hypothetical protein
VSLESSALDGFRTAGRSVVMAADDREEAWYVTVENLRGALEAAPELERLVQRPTA